MILKLQIGSLGKLKTYKVDLDYEAYLFDSQYNEDTPANLKIIREFEYIFFLVNQEKCNLKNIRNYEKIYLEKLKELNFSVPDLTPDAKIYEYWWGHHQDKKLEQMLNSKLLSAELAQKNQWGFQEGAIIDSITDLKIHVSKFSHIKKWIIKRADSFSGIGHYQFSPDLLNESFLSGIVKSKVLLEPVHERIFDIGTTIEVVNGKKTRHFMVENFNSQAGGFKGGAGASNVDKFKKYIFEKYSYSLDELEAITSKIADIYLSMGARSNIQIDSFIYKKDYELKLYALVEVNYRKTMGLVIQSLADKFSNASRVEWIIETSKFFKNHPPESNCIKLSPEGNHFQSFLKVL